jgi:hypothetical protein
MTAASLNFKSPLATRPITDTRSSSQLLIAVLFNETSWLEISVYGDISNEFSRGHYQRVSTYAFGHFVKTE